jgi:hypothetical protein
VPRCKNDAFSIVPTLAPRPMQSALHRWSGQGYRSQYNFLTGVAKFMKANNSSPMTMHMRPSECVGEAENTARMPYLSKAQAAATKLGVGSPARPEHHNFSSTAASILLVLSNLDLTQNTKEFLFHTLSTCPPVITHLCGVCQTGLVCNHLHTNSTMH